MGQRQLLCFARALLRVLASSVDLLLLDEAFSTVDPDGAARLLKVLLASPWSADLAMVSVNHDLAASMEFDTVALVDDGRVVEKGPPRELAAVQDGQFGRMARLALGSTAATAGA
jgi:ABC-type multidrug transport system fused ATPase/permease subunit